MRSPATLIQPGERMPSGWTTWPPAMRTSLTPCPPIAPGGLQGRRLPGPLRSVQAPQHASMPPPPPSGPPATRARSRQDHRAGQGSRVVRVDALVLREGDGEALRADQAGQGVAAVGD